LSSSSLSSSFSLLLIPPLPLYPVALPEVTGGKGDTADPGSAGSIVAGYLSQSFSSSRWSISISSSIFLILSSSYSLIKSLTYSSLSFSSSSSAT
jgi:hypothetical protein